MSDGGGDFEEGVSGTFYLTNYNTIIKCDIDKNYSYGIVIAASAKTGTFSNGVQAQIMTEKGEVKVFDFAETVSVFTSYYENIIDSSVDCDWSMDGFQPDSRLLIPAGTIVIYETNSDNEIIKIYVNAEAIEAKTDNRFITLDEYSEYSALTGKLDGKFLTEETVILAVPSASYMNNAEKYSLVSLEYLMDEECYTGYVLYDYNKVIKFAFITNFILKPAYNSSPMIVTGIDSVYFGGNEIPEYVGLIDGKVVRYMLNDAAAYISMTGDINPSKLTFPIEKNDVIQVVVNENNEIISYRHLLNWDSGKYYAMISEWFDEDATRPDYTANAKYVELGTAVTTADAQMYGAAVADRAYKVGSSYIEFNSAGDITYDDNVTAYIFGSNYAKAKVTTLDSAEVLDYYENYSDVDDIIYLYSYDGENVFAFIWDVRSDNK